MHTKTQKLMLQGSLILLSALVVSSIGGWARRATADDQPAAVAAPEAPGDLHSLEQSLEATRGELAVARLQLERANAIIDYSTTYHIAADLTAAIYDIALAEGVDPALAFRLVKTESNFTAKAKSKVGAIGYTQVLPSTARLYEPGLTMQQLYDRNTNLRLGATPLFLRDSYDVPRPDDRRERQAVVVQQRRERHTVAARDLTRGLPRPDAMAARARFGPADAPVAGLGGRGPGSGGHDPPAHGDDDPLADAQRVRPDVRVRALDHRDA